MSQTLQSSSQSDVQLYMTTDNDRWLSIEHEDVLFNYLEGVEKSVTLLQVVIPDRPLDFKPQEIKDDVSTCCLRRNAVAGQTHSLACSALE
jgi:hypothetical protein